MRWNFAWLTGKGKVAPGIREKTIDWDQQNFSKIVIYQIKSKAIRKKWACADAVQGPTKTIFKGKHHCVSKSQQVAAGPPIAEDKSFEGTKSSHVKSVCSAFVKEQIRCGKPMCEYAAMGT